MNEKVHCEEMEAGGGKPQEKACSEAAGRVPAEKRHLRGGERVIALSVCNAQRHGTPCRLSRASHNPLYDVRNRLPTACPPIHLIPPRHPVQYNAEVADSNETRKSSTAAKTPPYHRRMEAADSTRTRLCPSLHCQGRSGACEGPPPAEGAGPT